jgi:inner membrane protein
MHLAGRKEHLYIGVIVSIFLLLFLNSRGLIYGFEFILLAIASAAIGSRLPDLLEPPKGGYHRKFFHSIIFLILVLLFFIYTYAKILTANPGNEVAFGLFFAAAGYASHLIRDAFTPARIPLLGFSYIWDEI